MIKVSGVAGAKYSYKDLERHSDLLSRTLLNAPQASRIERKGVLAQTVYLNYSQEQFATHGLRPSDLKQLLNAENITQSAGTFETGASSVALDASGQFQSAKGIGDVVIGTTVGGAPVYLRDVTQISRGYQNPATYLNFYSWTDPSGAVHQSRAVTLAVYMRSNEQIQQFGKSVDEKLAQAKTSLPPDLILARTSDQPLQVKENIDLFMDALYEAVALVVVIALIGFWEWRSAVLMALSIPITLALTFALAQTCMIDLQQVSIATLIIALGLLVDDPVVANDAIKNELANGTSPLNASWLGHTKLARAIVYATITNIIAYLPFLLLKGSTGDFLYSLPIVMTAALVSSRLASTPLQEALNREIPGAHIIAHQLQSNPVEFRGDSALWDIRREHGAGKREQPGAAESGGTGGSHSAAATRSRRCCGRLVRGCGTRPAFDQFRSRQPLRH